MGHNFILIFHKPEGCPYGLFIGCCFDPWQCFLILHIYPAGPTWCYGCKTFCSWWLITGQGFEIYPFIKKNRITAAQFSNPATWSCKYYSASNELYKLCSHCFMWSLKAQLIICRIFFILCERCCGRCWPVGWTSSSWWGRSAQVSRSKLNPRVPVSAQASPVITVWTTVLQTREQDLMICTCIMKHDVWKRHAAQSPPPVSVWFYEKLTVRRKRANQHTILDMQLAPRVEQFKTYLQLCCL